MLFELAESPEALRQFADILVAMVEEIDRAHGPRLGPLQRARRSTSRHRAHLRAREPGDALYTTVIADLFKTDSRNPIEILKWKEIYDGLEDACDACKDYTHILGNVVIKNA